MGRVRKHQTSDSERRKMQQCAAPISCEYDRRNEIPCTGQEFVHSSTAVPSMVSRTLQYLEAYRSRATQSVFMFENTMQLEYPRHRLPILELAHVIQ